MAKQRNSTFSRQKRKKKIKGIFKLKLILEKMVQKSLLPVKRPSLSGGCYVPRDVKEGHFAVIAVDNYVEEENFPRRERFVVPLSFLTHPKFLELLEMAEEEFGFEHDGAVTVPCRPSELKMILADHVHRLWSGDEQEEDGLYE